MHDRLVNEVAMVERHARFIGRALASADTFRRSLGRGLSFASHSRALSSRARCLPSGLESPSQSRYSMLYDKGDVRDGCPVPRLDGGPGGFLGLPAERETCHPV